MTYMPIKFSIAAVLVISAVGYLTFAGVQGGWVYTVGVDQFSANAEQQKLRVRLCGKVSEEHLEVRKAQLAARFFIKGDRTSIAVSYKGVIPDMFKAGCEVVVEGKLDEAREFQADTLMTKCASKYEGKPKDHSAVAAGMNGGEP